MNSCSVIRCLFHSAITYHWCVCLMISCSSINQTLISLNRVKYTARCYITPLRNVNPGKIYIINPKYPTGAQGTIRVPNWYHTYTKVVDFVPKLSTTFSNPVPLLSQNCTRQTDRYVLSFHEKYLHTDCLMHLHDMFGRHRQNTIIYMK